ncbi:unnamed protein product [Leptidea sinapis]|uniref:Peptidase S1 domain-containing protein n=1 Tax=Leptidea sinapis TaxID=189913 RepID=A0A5E4QGQ6_9NEOP|nr:unnamed protein product [Leptidea sinapis]
MKSEMFVAILALIHLQGYANGASPKESFEVDNKIVGGYEAAIQEFPHQALVLVNTNGRYSLCGGSIVNALYILTSANCVAGYVYYIHNGHIRFIRNITKVIMIMELP